MKTYLKYGGAMAGAGFVSMVLCYVAGLWDAQNLGTGMIVGIVLGIIINTVGIVLGTRAVRSPTGTQGFSYGRAFKTGLLISSFAAAAGVVTNGIFFGVVNPNYHETTIVWTKGLMERMGAPAAQVEKAEEQMRTKGGLVRQLANGVIGALVFGGVISLITAAFMKRPPSDEETDGPPVIS